MKFATRTIPTKLVGLGKRQIGRFDEVEVKYPRWIVERTLSWADHSRRLSKDYEISTVSACGILSSTFLITQVGITFQQPYAITSKKPDISKYTERLICVHNCNNCGVLFYKRSESKMLIIKYLISEL